MIQRYNYEGKNLTKAQLAQSARQIKKLTRMKHTINMVPCGRTVLDIGSGIGVLAYELSKKSVRVTGIDALKSNVLISNELFKKNNLSYIHGLSDRVLPLFLKAHTRFGVITGCEVIEHMENPVWFLQTCHQLLEENGLLVLSTPNSVSVTNILVNLIRGNENLYSGIQGVEGDHKFEWSIRTLSRLLDFCGFDIIRHSFTKHSIIIKCKKRSNSIGATNG